MLLTMLLNLTSCSESVPVKTESAQTIPATEFITEPTEIPTTEPVSSPEEVPYNSLPDRMKQAVDAGLVELSQDGMQTFEQVMTAAQEYGVGFMLSDFGINYQTINDNLILPRVRYADEPYFAMITDITSAMETLGCSWCFSHWYGPYGVAFCMPLIQTANYEQIDDYPYYIDLGMMKLFRNVNGVQ